MDNSLPDKIAEIKKSAPFVTVILLLSVMAFVFTFNTKLGYLSDCTRYYLLGQSVAAGAGITQVWDVKQQPDGLSSPLYPLLIAMLSYTFTSSIIFIKSVNGVFLFGSILIFFYLYRRMKFSDLTAAIILVPFILNYWVLKHASIMLTEIPFIFLTGVSLALLFRTNDKLDLKDYYWWGALFFAVGAYYMRPIGIALAAAIVIAELLNKKWNRAAVSTLFFSITIIPWIVRGMNLAGQTHFKIISSINPLLPGGEMAGISDIVERIGKNFVNYISVYLPASMIPTFQQHYGSESVLGWITGLMLMSGIVFGLVRLKYRRTVLGSYIFIYLTILLIFPNVYTGQRFLLPLLPLLYPLFFIGIRNLSEYFNIQLKVPLGFILLLGAINLFSLMPLEDESSKPLLHQWTGYFETAKWANKNLPPEAIVAVRVAEEFYLHSLRKTITFPFIDDPEEIKEYLNYYKVTHLLSDDLDYPLTDMRIRTMPYLKLVMDQNPGLFKELYRSKGGETILFEIL